MMIDHSIICPIIQSVTENMIELRKLVIFRILANRVSTHPGSALRTTIEKNIVEMFLMHRITLCSILQFLSPLYCTLLSAVQCSAGQSSALLYGMGQDIGLLLPFLLLFSALLSTCCALQRSVGYERIVLHRTVLRAIGLKWSAIQCDTMQKRVEQSRVELQ